MTLPIQQIFKHPKAILLIQLGDIGDVVLSLPCIHALRHAFPQARLVVAVRDKAAGLLADNDMIDKVIVISKAPRTLSQQLCYQYHFFKELRALSCDVAIDLRTGTRGAILAMLSGAKQRLGFYADNEAWWRNRLFTALFNPPATPDYYVAYYLLDMLSFFGVPVKDKIPSLQVGPDKITAVDTLLALHHIDNKQRPFVAIQPFSLWQYKEWGDENISELIQCIVRDWQVNVVIIGSPAEKERAAHFCPELSENVFNLAGLTTLEMLPALLKQASLFFGMDSVGSHLAAAVGTPTITLFGPSSAGSWAPRGDHNMVIQNKFECIPCRQKGCEGSEYSRCLAELSVEYVYGLMRPELATIMAAWSVH